MGKSYVYPAATPKEPADLAVAECHESQSEAGTCSLQTSASHLMVAATLWQDSYVQRREKLRRQGLTSLKPFIFVSEKWFRTWSQKWKQPFKPTAWPLHMSPILQCDYISMWALACGRLNATIIG
jgi:hypothetical protein